ncbi:actin superfamily [Dorcoceras hygrometricum]|uniref:Actin superfamily n=1 Tax=Dorcoceras hygrometricum TaxID=472368 RepID=A0A2Z7DB47_9LAMI|nr:actin superfamily [Dorcoceras hygrometricum]
MRQAVAQPWARRATIVRQPVAQFYFSSRPPMRDPVRHSGEGGGNSRPSLAQQLRGLLRDAAPTSSRQRHASPRNARPALACDEARFPSREISDHRMPPCEKEAPAFASLVRPARKSRALMRARERGAAARGGGRWPCRNLG